MKERGRMMLKEIMMEAMVEAIEESQRHTREKSLSEEGRSGAMSTGERSMSDGSMQADDSDQSSSSRLGWVIPIGVGLVTVYLWQRKKSGEEGVQKSITEWKDDKGSSSGGNGGESALSDENSGQGTPDDPEKHMSKGVDTDGSEPSDVSTESSTEGSGSSMTDDDDDDGTAETTETA